ncbi:MAG: phosphatidylglycerophosphatase A [Rickettsiales bacterium]|nr:phosphatidylglycerophosphatase A [Rickettsiales bacterium]
MKRHSLSTMYGVGLIGVAPGTAGSLVAALLAYPILLLPFGYAWLTGAALLLLVLGTAQASRFMRDRNTTHDPKEIVIDELVGMWLTYSVWYGWLVAIAGNLERAQKLLNEVAAMPIYLVIGFVFFRLFDIVKPWPISWADRRMKSGFGVMFDDVLAAIAAGTLLYVVYLFTPYFTGQLEVTP